MRFRKLRIAWSVFWGLAAVLLVALLVRSYWRLDVWVGNESKTTIVRTDTGLITCSRANFVSSLSKQAGWVHIVEIASFGMVYWQFDWKWRSDMVLVRTPIWIPALIAAMLAGVPWIRWSRQFTIRTMLILTALVALVLGVLVSFE